MFAKASHFIATHYGEDIISFDGELDLFIRSVKNSTAKDCSVMAPFKDSDVRNSMGNRSSQIRSSVNYGNRSGKSGRVSQECDSVVNLVVATKNSMA